MAATSEIVSGRPRLLSRVPRPGRKTAIAATVLLTLVLVGAGGVAWATYDYSQEYEGRLLPGTTIAHVDVGGMTYEEAENAVRAVVGPQLSRQITIRWRGESWTASPRELGASSNLAGVISSAVEATEDASFFHRMRMRLFDDRLGFERGVAITYPRRGARRFIDRIASAVNVEPRDATIDYSTGWVDMIPARTGYRLQKKASFQGLMKSLRSDDGHVPLSVKTLKPESTAEDFDQILLVRIGENMLYLYENGKITNQWPIATGQPEYMTPTGMYSVTEKRYMPTWVNPAPDTWGASMPVSIPPGPSNPLGLRALNWSAPAIRFHGTSATYSLGFNASHGCVRLSNEDVIQLYDMIDVGTPIVSVVAGELKPLYVSAPDPIPVPEEGGSGDSTADSGDAPETQSDKGDKKGGGGN
ncbi:MAG: L,D-transpeptidase family protein [Actinomycetota bacterium]